MEKILVTALTKQWKVPPPIWIMRQAGRYLPEYHAVRNKKPDFIELCLSPDIVTELTLQPIERFAFDGAVIFSDILVIPFALGQGVSFVPKPQLTQLDLSVCSANLADTGKFLETLQPVYDAIKQVKGRLAPETSLIGFAGAPWTLGGYMVNGDIEQFRKILPILIAAIVIHLRQQILAGADVIQLFDSASASCPLAYREEFITKPVADIFRVLQLEFKEVPMIYYSRGIPEVLMELNRCLPKLVLSLDHELTHEWVKENLPSDVAIQGNLDADVLIQGGEPLRLAVEQICNGFKKHRFVFNLGHGIRPETPLENVYDLVRLVRAHGE
ncbi:MAG: uroporphyrinogen decarboxylase family protein [Alphaproteobacteria bacterium]